jgi:hypothetical protein
VKVDRADAILAGGGAISVTVLNETAREDFANAMRAETGFDVEALRPAIERARFRIVPVIDEIATILPG